MSNIHVSEQPAPTCTDRRTATVLLPIPQRLLKMEICTVALVFFPLNSLTVNIPASFVQARMQQEPDYPIFKGVGVRHDWCSMEQSHHSQSFPFVATTMIHSHMDDDAHCYRHGCVLLAPGLGWPACDGDRGLPSYFWICIGALFASLKMQLILSSCFAAHAHSQPGSSGFNPMSHGSPAACSVPRAPSWRMQVYCRTAPRRWATSVHVTGLQGSTGCPGPSEGSTSEGNASGLAPSWSVPRLHEGAAVVADPSRDLH